MDFWKAYRVLSRRKWIILAVVMVTTLVAVAGVQMFGQKYDATVSFVPTDKAIQQAVNAINEGTGQVVVTDDTRIAEAKHIASGAMQPANIYQAIQGLAGTPTVISALDRLGLGVSNATSGGNTPRHDQITKLVRTGVQRMSPKQIGDLETQVNLPSGVWPDFVYLYAKLKANNVPLDFLQPELIAAAVQDVATNIEPNIDDPRNVIVKVRDNNPRLAEVLASAIAAVYKNKYDEDNHRAALKKLADATKEKQAAQKSFDDAQQALARFRQANKEVFLTPQTDAALQRNNTARTEIDQINAELRDLDAQLAAKKARLISLPRMLTHETKIENPEIALLRERINGLSADLAAKSGIWTDKNPEIVRLKDQIAALQARLDRVQGTTQTDKVVTENEEWLSTERDIAHLNQERNGKAARIGILNGIIARQASLIANLPDATEKMRNLTGARNQAGEHLADVTKRFDAARVNLQNEDAEGALTIGSWAGTGPSTPQHGEAPAEPGAKKMKVAIVAMAFLLSLVGSTCVILAMDFMDNSVKTTVDVERMLDVPVNGIVPRLEGASRAMLPQVTHKLPSSPHAESYRFLGTDILLSAAGPDPFKTIMVATAKPGQGGTSTVCNLAITLAQAGQTVALVDADLRRPSLHHVFSLENTQGLTTVLSNGKLPSDVLQRTDIDNLYVMTGGPMTDNAWKLLRSAKMRDVIADLSRDFDFVLFDTPSAVVFADAATLATMVDGVLMVVRAHESPCGSELQVKNLLNKTKARIVGVVLNDMPVQQVDSARFFSHYYAPSGARTELAGAAKPALPSPAADDEI